MISLVLTGKRRSEDLHLFAFLFSFSFLFSFFILHFSFLFFFFFFMCHDILMCYGDFLFSFSLFALALVVLSLLLDILCVNSTHVCSWG